MIRLIHRRGSFHPAIPKLKCRWVGDSALYFYNVFFSNKLNSAVTWSSLTSNYKDGSCVLHDQQPSFSLPFRLLCSTVHQQQVVSDRSRGFGCRYMCSSVLLGGFNVKQTSLSIFNLLAQIQPKGLRPAPFPEQAGFTFLFLCLQKGLFEAITLELWATVCWKSVD